MYKFLIPGINIALKFTKSNLKFQLFNNKIEDFKTLITDSALHIQKAKYSPNLSLVHVNMLK